MEKRRKDDRRPRDFWEHFFNDFNDDFITMRRQMDKFVRDSLKSFDNESDTKKPFVYGFSIRLGPDGIPRIEQFGDTKFGRPGHSGKGQDGGREPLTDVIEAEDHIAITMELPGIEKQDITMEIRDDNLVIDIDTDTRKYHKELRLPENLDLESIEATYKNGLLDIEIQRMKEKPKKAKRIEIK